MFACDDLLRLVLRRLPANEAGVRLATDVLSGVSRGVRAAARELVADAEWLAHFHACTAAFVRDTVGRVRNRSNATQDMLRGMRVYRSSVSVQMAALDALRNLMVHGFAQKHAEGVDTATRVRCDLLVDADALASVVSTMRVHRRNEDVGLHCFTLLGLLLPHRQRGGDPSDCGAAVGFADGAGAFAHMLATMHAHPQSDTLWARGHNVMLECAAWSAAATATVARAEASRPQLRARQ